MCERKWWRCAPVAQWWVQRNPTYLFSAACMAIGARLYLTNPSARAGDVGLILLTLGFLQAYEWAVGAILIVLHRWRRAPEDQPSLLLVAALFWTGPMAATVEMTAHRPDLGLYCAIGAAVIALVELHGLRRALGLRISLAGQAAGGFSVLLLVVAPPLLRVPDSADGTNELYLYYAWWVLAGIALLGLGTLRSRVPNRSRPAGHLATPADLGNEMVFIVVLVIAVAAHLAGMNHAFFTNARFFYASPLLAAVSLVTAEAMYRTGRENGPLSVFCIGTPLLAIALASQPFHENVPVQQLPCCLRDVMVTTLVLAGAAWWFGFYRRRFGVMLHAGTASLACAAYRAVHPLIPEPTIIETLSVAPEPSRYLVVIALYAITGYLLLTAVVRRSKFDALIAVAAHCAAATALVWERTRADNMIVALLIGWSALVALHIIARQRHALLAFCPVAFLAAATCLFDFDEPIKWYARLHAPCMVLVLFVAGQCWPSTRYRSMALIAGAAHLCFHVGRGVSSGSDPTATATVIGAFTLLVAGAAISWYKHILLDRTDVPGPKFAEGDSGS